MFDHSAHIVANPHGFIKVRIKKDDPFITIVVEFGREPNLQNQVQNSCHGHWDRLTQLKEAELQYSLGHLQ